MRTYKPSVQIDWNLPRPSFEARGPSSASRVIVDCGYATRTSTSGAEHSSKFRLDKAPTNF